MGELPPLVSYATTFPGTAYYSSSPVAAQTFGPNLTIELFFNVPSGGYSQYGVIVDGSTDANGLGAVAVELSSRGFLFHNSLNVVLSATAFFDGKWHHLALVGNDNAKLTLYIDGIAKTSRTGTFSGSPITNGSSIHIGSRPVGPYNFKGQASNLRILNNHALYTGNFIPPRLTLSTQGDPRAYKSLVNVNYAFTSDKCVLLCLQNNTNLIDNANPSRTWSLATGVTPSVALTTITPG